MVFKVFGGIWGIFILLAIVVIRTRKYQKPWGCFFLGGVAQMILAIPAGIMLGRSVKFFPSETILNQILTPFASWPFNVGGKSVAYLFQISAHRLDWLLGGRESEIQYIEYYLFLMAIQFAIVAFIVGARWYISKKVFDWFVILILALFVINSLAGSGEICTLIGK